MMKRIILGAILGGLAMFIWDFIAHEVLPLGEAGVKSIDNEPLQTAIQANIKDAGFYIFPAPDISGMSKAQQEAAMQQAAEKMRKGPTGIMVVYPQGREFVMPKNLATQYISDVLEMLVAGVLVAWATRLKAYTPRLAFITILGLIPALATLVPQWNWYGFPTLYMLSQTVTTLLGFLAGGLVVAKLVHPRFAA